MYIIISLLYLKFHHHHHILDTISIETLYTYKCINFLSYSLTVYKISLRYKEEEKSSKQITNENLKQLKSILINKRLIQDRSNI